jgi:Protein of unknown function (DUF3593)
MFNSQVIPLRRRFVSTIPLTVVPYLLSILVLFCWNVNSFAPRSTTPTIAQRSLNMVVDSDWLLNGGFLDSGSSCVMDSVVASSSNLLSFSDQGQNLAGIFFQASLLPYLLFLYFLSFRGNRISDLGNFGFQFVLLFVLSTIPSGIISKSVYGYSLANTDWLHGGAESLLTVANVLIVSTTKRRILWNMCGLSNPTSRRFNRF